MPFCRAIMTRPSQQKVFLPGSFSHFRVTFFLTTITDMIGIPGPKWVCDYKREETEAEPSFEITLYAIAATGSNIIRSPISSPKKNTKRKKKMRQEQENAVQSSFPRGRTMSTASRVESEEMEEFISNLFLSPKRRKG